MGSRIVFEQVLAIGKGSSSANSMLGGSSNPSGGGVLAPVTNMSTSSMEGKKFFVIRDRINA